MCVEGLQLWLGGFLVGAPWGSDHRLRLLDELIHDRLGVQGRESSLKVYAERRCSFAFCFWHLEALSREGLFIACCIHHFALFFVVVIFAFALLVVTLLGWHHFVPLIVTLVRWFVDTWRSWPSSLVIVKEIFVVAMTVASVSRLVYISEII